MPPEEGATTGCPDGGFLTANRSQYGAGFSATNRRETLGRYGEKFVGTTILPVRAGIFGTARIVHC
jgi:hypothetical protein